MLHRSTGTTSVRRDIRANVDSSRTRYRTIVAGADKGQRRPMPDDPSPDEELDDDEDDVMPSPDVLPVPPDDDDQDDLEAPHTSDADGESGTTRDGAR